MRVHAPTVVACCLLLAVLVAASPGQAKVEAQRDLGLRYLAGKVPTAGSLAANIAEAAHANGQDLRAWPTADDPVAGRVLVPGANAGNNVSILRPLRALAFAQDLRADPDEGTVTQRVLGHFTASGYGEPTLLNDDAYAILAVRAAGIPSTDQRVQAARAHLLANQNDDGGWGWSTTATSGTDMTGIVLEALLYSGGAPDDVAAKVGAFLATTRDADAGFGEGPADAPNCESTVWGLRASARLGTDLRGADWGFLLGLQTKDGGFAHLPGGEADLLCTTEAVGLLGEVDPASIETPRGGGRGIPAPGAGSVLLLLAATAFVVMSTRLREA